MKLFKVLYSAVGVGLLAGTVLTGSYGLSAEDQAVYEDAVELQDEVDALGFADFNLKDYKVRFFNGSSDYVISDDKIRKEKAVFNTFIGTAYEVDGEYQVILPTLANFSELFKLLDGAEKLGQGEMSFAESEYGSNEHITTLWHEAVHAYQFTNYETNIRALLAKEIQGENFQDSIISTVDGNRDVVELFKKQMELLNRAHSTKDLDRKKELTLEYLAMEQERRAMLDDEARSAEDYYELVEGTARYVESRVYGLLEGVAAEQRYTGDWEYEKGMGKYYVFGMFKCYLLDELAPDWKNDYDFSVSLNDLLAAL